ncbi:MAG: TlpA family protein disulfide reductase [Flavobacterium sp.]
MKILFCLIICFPIIVLSQTKTDLTISLNSNIKKENISIFFNNGKKTTEFNLNDNQKKIRFNDYYFSNHATISLFFKLKNDTIYKKFYISNKKSSIYVNENFELHLKNVIDPNNLITEYNEVIKDLELIKQKHSNEKGLDSTYFNIFKDLIKSKLKFIKKYNNSYFSFKLFKEEIMPIKFPFKDSLIDSFEDFYISTFDKEVHKSIEGIEIDNHFKNNNITFKKNIIAPTYTIKDINGHTIQLNKTADKNILLIFWASWCAPCIKELKDIKEYIKLNKPNDLLIVLVSLDKDFNKFLKSKEQYGFDWIHVFNDNNLVNLFGAHKFIPQMYLINKKGKIIYNKSIELNIDNDLGIIKDILNNL